MPISLHIALLSATVVVPAACIAIRYGRTNRRSLLFSLLPFLLIGSLSLMTLSIGGKPILEWLIPMLGVFAAGVWCRSDVIFQSVRWSFPVVSSALCLNFLMLIQGDYTANPTFQVRFNRTRETIGLKQAAKHIQPNAPAGPIGTVERRLPVPEWHTPITRMYRIERQEATIWSPGGPDAEKHLEVRL